MNVERMLELADYIEGLPHHDDAGANDEAAFLLSAWFIDYRGEKKSGFCGTAGCIAGSAVMCFDGDPDGPIGDQARELLGLAGFQSMLLFEPPFTLSTMYDRVMPRQAARVLRAVAAGASPFWAWWEETTQ